MHVIDSFADGIGPPQVLRGLASGRYDPRRKLPKRRPDDVPRCYWNVSSANLSCEIGSKPRYARHPSAATWYWYRRKTCLAIQKPLQLHSLSIVRPEPSTPVESQITRFHLAFDDGHWSNGKL
jgi:hypothetical protein